MKKARLYLPVVLALATGIVLAPAAAAIEPEGNHSIAFYGYAPFLDGDVSFGQNESALDFEASDVIDSLELAAMARYRGQTERWAFVVDGQFAGLGDTAHEGPATTDFDLDLFIIHADGAYRFSEHSEALFGLRYVELDAELDVRFANGADIHRGNDASFVDPVIGLRTLRPIGDRLLLQAQGDVGGGGGMDFTWQGMIHLGYQTSESLSLWIGYRALAMDFDDSGGRNRLSADLVLHGPAAGVAFSF